jgi:hypothetical protein
MDPAAEPLRLYGAVADAEGLEWEWVQRQLDHAGTYWVVARGSGHPHPRPVWGVFARDGLHLSIGSPVLARDLAADPIVTVHLDSGTDVVVVEGLATLESAEASRTHLDAYNLKYDWDYTIDQYGPLTHVQPERVMAWRSAGWAGRDGFQRVGRWRFG